MKILLISSNSSGRGGGEQYLVYLSKGLKAAGQEVIVLLSNRSYMDAWENQLKEIGVEVRREDLIGLRDRPLRMLQSTRDKKQIRRIASICEEIKPDIIHVNQQYDADGLDYIMGALRFGKAPVVGTIHNPMTLTKHPRSKKNFRTLVINLLSLDKVKTLFLKNWYKKYNYAKILVSRAMKNEFASFGNVLDQYIVIHGIDLDRFPYFFDDKKNKTIGFCGRFVPHKNIFLIIKAWLNSRKKGLDSKLLLIGDGPLRKDIEVFLKNNALRDSWNITGWVDDHEDYMKQLSLLILASSFEGWGLVVVEASCMGERCLCTNFPAAVELKEKILFLTVVDSYDPDVLGDAIIEILKKSPPTKEEVIKVRDYFSCTRMAQDTLNIYRELLKNELS